FDFPFGLVDLTPSVRLGLARGQYSNRSCSTVSYLSRGPPASIAHTSLFPIRKRFRRELIWIDHLLPGSRKAFARSDRGAELVRLRAQCGEKIAAREMTL